MVVCASGLLKLGAVPNTLRLVLCTPLMDSLRPEPDATPPAADAPAPALALAPAIGIGATMLGDDGGEGEARRARGWCVAGAAEDPSAEVCLGLNADMSGPTMLVSARSCSCSSLPGTPPLITYLSEEDDELGETFLSPSAAAPPTRFLKGSVKGDGLRGLNRPDLDAGRGAWPASCGEIARGACGAC
jgi:hypothetical protein